MSSPANQRLQAELNPRVKQEVSGGGGSAIWKQITELARLPTIVADLGQGYPDFQGDAVARQHAAEIIRDDVKLNQYSLVNGTGELRQDLAEYYAKRYPGSKKLDANTQVLITSSGTEALFASIHALVSPGDEVVVFEPSFPWCRSLVLGTCGGELTLCQTHRTFVLWVES